ncbi:unnamed protein product [Closterium sp. Yama58-4]|nr:unnamed protein product [Closterium sp. Yama58-4]
MKALTAVSMRKSVFVTGCAGTGKSFVLEFAIRSLRAMHGSDAVYVTASTGLAACALSGTTLHSFAGVGLGNGSKEDLLHKVQTRREARQRWQGARALVIDEISMIDAQFFDNLEFIARKIRKSSKPFGGIQLLVTGDFFQLPPVNPQSNVAYAFEAKCWNDCFDLQMELKHVFRQSDLSFVSILNEIREGIVTPATQERLRKRIHCAPIGNDGIMLTKLYPYKADVAGENFQRLRELQEMEMTYNAKDEGKSEYAKKQLEFTRAEKRLTLRRGAQVMLIKNLDTPQGLVNGARGVVVGFCDPTHPSAAQFRHLAPIINPSGMWPVVRFACDQSERIIGPESWAVEEYGAEIAKRWQVPLTLAWALSVHKCQGMTLDRVETDLKRAFDYGMVYVALSRVRSLEGLRLLGFDAGKVKVNVKVVEFYKLLQRHDASSKICTEV